MQIDAAHRQATLSVGAFAAFTPYATPGFGGAAALWRAQVGSTWHQRIQADSLAADDGFRNEISIAGSLAWRQWTLRLAGRIDQLKTTADRLHLREIKTVAEPLPLSHDALLERYPSYPVQLLTYRELLLQQSPDAATVPLPQAASASPDAFRLELLFVEIGSGLTQTLALDPTYDRLLADQLDNLVDYLEAQQERLARLRALAVRPVYPKPRPGQESIQADLKDAFDQARVTLLEAPTGYGKTGVAWEYAARRLANGQSDRVLYLTSKATGQTEAVTRLRALLQRSTPDAARTPPASFWHIRNKQEHCIHTEFRCSRQTCPYLADLHDKWKRSGLQRLYFLSHDEIDLDTLRAEGRSTGICPYEIMRAGLGHRDFWIGDYNYLFSPASARLLDEQPDFDPSSAFLIVDEAHNLPSRVQSAYTYDFSLHPLYAAIDDLQAQRGPASLRSLLKSLAQILADAAQPSDPPGSRNARARQANPFSQAAEADFRLHLSQIAERLPAEAIPFEDLLPETLELLFQISAAHAGQQRGELRHLLWSPAPGAARLECIDASKLIASQLSQYNAVLFLSATLAPLDAYLDEIGLSASRVVAAGAPSAASPSPPSSTAAPALAYLAPPAPWREKAYDVAIDLRVDTRLKSRQAHLPTTADAIARAAETCRPAIAFFPSYAYAQQAYDALQLKHPFIRVALQPRSGGSLADRAAYLEEALAFHDALLLILGSSYAEGVDTLGGKAGAVIVVSPALPEMNLIQEAKRDHHQRQGRDGFERAYLQPGIQKVNQALGRLVRAPEHRVKALLHCQRFAEPKTRSLLDPLYQTKNYIHNADDLQAWLSQSPAP